MVVLDCVFFRLAERPDRGMWAASRTNSSSLASGSSECIVEACWRRLSNLVNFLPHRQVKGFSPANHKSRLSSVSMYSVEKTLEGKVVLTRVLAYVTSQMFASRE